MREIVQRSNGVSVESRAHYDHRTVNVCLTMFLSFTLDTDLCLPEMSAIFLSAVLKQPKDSSIEFFCTSVELKREFVASVFLA